VCTWLVVLREFFFLVHTRYNSLFEIKDMLLHQQGKNRGHAVGLHDSNASAMSRTISAGDEACDGRGVVVSEQGFIKPCSVATGVGLAEAQDCSLVMT
jgi:hypothetical protein